jgi:twitching motility protein PilT
MAALDELFQYMVQEGASDLHIAPGYPPFFRLHGHMIKLNTAPLTSDKCERIILETMSQEQLEVFRNNWELDWSYQLVGQARFRANAFIQNDGVGAVYRMIPEKVKTIEELGLPDVLRQIADLPKGLILTTGPTGSGKSTTQMALIQHINMTRKEHIITIEDPIEYLHRGINCLINQREVHRHTKSFSAALRSALREDPDVILVGEMRDLETISLTLTAAETGHLVLATLHTSSAAKSVDRVIDSFSSDQQAQIRVMLSESLAAVVSQTLLPRADQAGMVPALEVLIVDHAVRNLIRENKTYQIPSVIQTSSRKGMISFEASLKSLVERGLVTPATASTFLGSLATPQSA